MRFFRNSIKVRLTVVTVMFSLIVIVALVFVSLFQVQQVIRANMLQSVEFNLHLASQIIQEEFRALNNLRLSTSISPQTIAYLSGDVEDFDVARLLHAKMTDDIRDNPAVRFLRRLIVANSDLSSWVQVGLFADRTPMTAQVLGYFGDFSEASLPVWSGIKTEPTSVPASEPVFSMITPVYQPRGEQVIGFVYISVSSNIILSPLIGYPRLEQGNLYILLEDAKYMIIDGEFLQVEMGFADAVPGEDVPMNPATEIFSYSDEHGDRHLAVLSPLGLTGISLVQTFPSGLVLEEIYFFARLLLPIALGVFALGVSITIFLYRSINKPVVKIGQQFKVIAGGDFAPNPEIEWDNEFGEIGRGVNKLASDVESLMESRIEDEKRKQDLEYKMLQNQINPHFLYNTLNSIKWMATIQKADGIAEMTTSLSRLLRSIAKINQSLVPLSKELALLEDYFVISRYRYGGSITTHIEVPEELMDCYIPVFTLQPIVENSIFHGIEPNGGIGSVFIKAERVGDVLEITVEDDGIGMDDDKITKLFEVDETDNHAFFREIGIFNVHARIRHEFGANYGLSMISKQGEFTRVVVRLPFGGSERGALRVDKVAIG